MFENEVAINEWQMRQFDGIVKDLSDAALFQPGPGHGHPPVWILGHLAISGEMGQRILGGSIKHIEWLGLFGKGSTDKIAPTPALTLPILSSAMTDAYREMRALAMNANPEKLARPHGVELFADSPVKTAGQLVSLLLTSHFGFHLAQLSSCRRSAGHAALF